MSPQSGFTHRRSAGTRSAAFFISCTRANSVFVDGVAKSLGKGITDNPLVSRKVTAGYVYRSRGDDAGAAAASGWILCATRHSAMLTTTSSPTA